jgi:hypothetical protein
MEESDTADNYITRSTYLIEAFFSLHFLNLVQQGRSHLPYQNRNLLVACYTKGMNTLHRLQKNNRKHMISRSTEETHSTEQSGSLEADSCSTTQEIPRLLCVLTASITTWNTFPSWVLQKIIKRFITEIILFWWLSYLHFILWRSFVIKNVEPWITGW